jgi:hypothetical protein
MIYAASKGRNAKKRLERKLTLYAFSSRFFSLQAALPF